jgi:hypothetical protein
MLTGWGRRMIDDGDLPACIDRILAKPPKLADLKRALVGRQTGCERQLIVYAQGRADDVQRPSVEDVKRMADDHRSIEHCEQKRRLLADYDAATRTFSENVSALNRQIGTSSKEAFDMLRRSVDEARVKSEQARLALEAHVASHGC